MHETYTDSIIHADSLTLLPNLPPGSVDFVLTDPPYMTRYASRDGRSILNDDCAAWPPPFPTSPLPFYLSYDT